MQRYLLARGKAQKPVRAELGLTFCADDYGTPSPKLFELGLNAAKLAIERDLSDLIERNRKVEGAQWYATHPGEHYRFLASLVELLAPKRIVEIGTFTGMSGAAILETMPAEGRLTTFDILPWDQFDTHLRREDFESGRISQELADLSQPDAFAKHANLLSEADFIFCDAPKDGVFEWRFLKLLTSLPPKPGRVMMLDDIKVLNMIGVWQAIESPKVDLTSVGHWSGTGLVDVSEGFRFAARD